MAKCLNCPKEVWTLGTKPKRYCSDACRMAFKRKAKLQTNTSTNEQVETNSHIVTKTKGWTPTDTIDGAMAMKAEHVGYWIGDKKFKTRQESDAEFTRLMVQDDRSRPNQRVSKPGDADYDGICRQDAEGVWCVPKRQAVGAER